jgi:transcription initiation factor TFIIIB Brf1 subunit/transcription initiation factor TFIIB
MLNSAINRYEDYDLCPTIFELLNHIEIQSIESFIGASARLYNLAIQCNFGRRLAKTQIAAACFFLVCRRDKRPLLLKDISEYIKINLSVLRTVYLQICKLFRIEEQPFHLLNFDPKIHIFQLLERLNVGNIKKNLLKTCLEFIDYFKKKWFHTGRYPHGTCIIAYQLSSLMHSVIRAEKYCRQNRYTGERTFDERILEFLYSDSSLLTKKQHKLTMVEYIRSFHKTNFQKKLLLSRMNKKELQSNASLCRVNPSFISNAYKRPFSSKYGHLGKKYVGWGKNDKICLKFGTRSGIQKNNLIFPKKYELNTRLAQRTISKHRGFFLVCNVMIVPSYQLVHFLSDKASFAYGILFKEKAYQLEEMHVENLSKLVHENEPMVFQKKLM